jgi:hypothetical protein
MTCARTLIPSLLLLFCLAGSPAWSEDFPPSRVGRVSAVEGSVAVRPAGGEWADSGINVPVAAGMSVRTPAQGRAVVRIGAETIALAASSEFEVVRLDAGVTQIALRQGRIGVRLAHKEPRRSIEIDIARGGVWLLTAGDYDITAGDERAPSRIAVFDGRARFVGKGPGDAAIDTTTTTGSATLLGGGDPVVASVDSAAGDDFVAWWRPPSTAGADQAALRHLSSEMTGYEALDGNGRWKTVDAYGAVWFPAAVPDDWAPYRYGHWRWIAPWGWSWIDDMPWGFAPSHYGRWASIPELDRLDPSDRGPERWGWVPGRRVADPVYASAVVAFLGTARVGLSYPDAFGPAVAWFPLAPGDVYWPGHTSDLDAIRRINEGAVADLSAIAAGTNGEPPAEIVKDDYPNRRFASVVPRSVFLAGRAVAASLLQLPGQRLANAPLLTGSPQIAPPAPRSAAVASASRVANRLADATSRRLARTMHTLAGILKPPAQVSATQVRVTQVRVTQVRVTKARPARTQAARRALPVRSSQARAARPPVPSARSPHTTSPRLRLATINRAIAR